MPVDDIWSIKLVCRSGNQLGINDLKYRVLAINGTGATAVQVATAFDNAFAPVVKPLLCAAAQWRGVIATKIFPKPPDMSGLSSGNVGAGTGGPSPLPAQVAGLITKLTAYSGRKYRGRVYVPFPATSDIGLTDQVSSANYQTRLQTMAAVVFALQLPGAGGNTLNMAPVIFTRKDSISTLVIGARVNPAWATQRRRGGYGRQNPINPV
jgi:hypothetical protein